MKSFQHDRLTVAYQDAGQGPAIVFVHNGGTSSTIWRHQMTALASSHRVFALDLPGFGASERPEIAVRLSDMVDLVIALMEAENLAPALLVGNCMGANIATAVARRRPESVSGVLVINPLSEVSFSGGRIGFLHTASRRFGAPMRLLRSVARRLRTPRFAGSLALRFQLGPKGTTQNLHHDPELLACQLRADQLPALIDVLDDMPAYGEMDAMSTPASVPIWIAWGEHNLVLSKSRSFHLTHLLHANRVDTVVGCGHLPMLEDPEAITSLIIDLDQQVNGTSSESEAQTP